MKACSDVKLNYMIQKVLGLLSGKQNILTFDSELSKDGTGVATSGVIYDALVATSGGIYDALDKSLATKQDALILDSELTQDGDGYVTSGVIHDAITKKEDRFPIGTVLTTVRTDLSDDWALCDGTLVTEETDPDIYPLLSSKSEEYVIKLSHPSYRLGKKIYGRNAIAISSITHLSKPLEFGDSGNNGGIGYFDMDTTKEVFVSISEMQLVSGSATKGYFFGFDWNGEKWVMCLKNNTLENIVFYTSSDLKSWTQTGTIACAEISSGITITGYPCHGFFYDGVVYHVLGDMDGYAGDNHLFVSAEFTLEGKKGNSYELRYHRRYQLCGDLLFEFYPYAYDSETETGVGGDVYIYSLGGQSYIKMAFVGSSQAVWKYDDDHYIFFPYEWYWYGDEVYVYEKSTNSFASVPGGIGAYADDERGTCSQPYYDLENDRLVFLNGVSTEQPTHYVYLPYGADPTVAANYTTEEIPITDTELLKLEQGNYLNDVKSWYKTSWDDGYSYVHICDSKFRTLPNIDSDHSYSYIKVKES